MGWRLGNSIIFAMLFAAFFNAATGHASELDNQPPAGGGFTPEILSDKPLQISGNFQVVYFPRTNEYDPNFGIPLAQQHVARYAIASDVTLRTGDLPFFFKLYDFLALGRSVPQSNYNYDPTPISLELQPAIGFDINPNWDARVTFDQVIDLGQFTSHNEVTPWLALSTRLKTSQPLDVANLAEIAGFAQASLYVPYLEYPVTPGASTAGQPTLDFSRDQIVNARYGISLEGSIRPRMEILDHIFLFGTPEFFFGNATLHDHWNFGASPISMTVKIGAGILVTPRLDVRITESFTRRLAFGPDKIDKMQWTGISVVWGI